MARKLDQGPPDGSLSTSAGTEESTTITSDLLSRRTFVQAGIATAAATVGLASTSAASATDDYEIITLAPGEQRRYVLNDGEQFENVLIDQRADGAMFYIAVEEGANNWAIRNVGWKGVAPTGSGDRDGTFLIHVRGNGVIENVFIDQRHHDRDEPGSDVGAIWTYSQSHNGHVECRHNFIAGCGNNASYDSGEGWDHYGGSGTVSHHRSYHRDNTPSNFRPGQADSRVTECVSVGNDPEGKRGTYPASDSQWSRAVWAWHNADIVVEDCAFWWDPNDVVPVAPFWATHRPGSEGSSCELTLVNCDINVSWEQAGYPLVEDTHGGSGSTNRSVSFDGLGYEPSVSVLGDGVPLTPEMAARGERALPPELGTAPSAGHGEPDEVPGEGADDAEEDGSDTAPDEEAESDAGEDESSVEESETNPEGGEEEEPAIDNSGAHASNRAPPRTMTEPREDGAAEADPDEDDETGGGNRATYGVVGAVTTIGAAGYFVKRRLYEQF